MGARRSGGTFDASDAAVVGRYTYRPDTDEWTWSEAMFVIHGLEPGSVVPTTELVMQHMHPDDREAAWQSRDAAVDDRQPSTFLHRIVRADGAERVVIAAGHAEEQADRTPLLAGHLIDLTDIRREAVETEVGPEVASFNQHRAVIEQAKGVLMQLYSVHADDAFALLRAFSMDANMKVRDVATVLTAAAASNTTPARGRTPSAHDVLEALHADPPAFRDGGKGG